MKYSFILILLITTNIYSQKKKNTIPSAPGPPGSPGVIVRELDLTCKKKYHISFEKRILNYPFEQSTQIKLVSFIPERDEYGDYGNYQLPIKNDTVCYSKLKEVKILNLKQINELTNLLYNYGTKDKFNGDGGKKMGCYKPRNAILFIDKNGKTFEYIEICFECQSAEKSSPKINFGEICDYKYDLIQKFFKKVGIQIGTIENEK